MDCFKCEGNSILHPCPCIDNVLQGNGKCPKEKPQKTWADSIIKSRVHSGVPCYKAVDDFLKGRL